MELDNTIQAMQVLGKNVVKESRSILKKKKKQTKSNDLYRGLDYLVTAKQNTITLEFEFGRAEDYWQFVDEGVKGSGGFKGSGRMRGQGSPFRFRKKNIAKGVVEKWIANKPLRLRGTDGKFMAKTKNNIKSAAFLIGRAIAQRGLERTQFFSKPLTEELNKQTDAIVQGLAEDIELSLEQSLT
jgi:hypothetical protein